jgi:hypothetical protein
MAAAQPVAQSTERPPTSGYMIKDYPKGQRYPKITAPVKPGQFYKAGVTIEIYCYEDWQTTAVWGDP